MSIVPKKSSTISPLFCLIVLWGVVLIPCFSAFAKGPQTTVKELAFSQKSWDGARLPAYPAGQPEIACFMPDRQAPLSR